jgi:hypothetical protein
MAGYGDDTAFAAWLTEEGLTLPGGAPAPAVLRQRGSRYIDATYGDRFVGEPTDGIDQDRAWPRSGAVVHGVSIADDVVPNAVIEASFLAAFQEATSPGSLSGGAVSGTALVKRERVEGAVEVEYAVSEKTDLAAASRVILPAVEGILAPFLAAEATGFGIWSV